MDKTALTEIKRISKENHEPEWFTHRRLEAKGWADELPLPKMEHFNGTEISFSTDKVPVLYKSDFSKLPLDTKTNLTQFGQTTVQIKLSQEMKDKGIILTDIFDALQRFPELIQKYFMSQVLKGNENKLNAANLAYLNSGVLLYLPKNTVLSDPVEIKLIQDSTKKINWYSHLLIVAEQGSSVRFLQHLTTFGENSNVANMIVEIVAKQDSSVQFSSVEELSSKTTFYFDRRAQIAKDAHVEWAIGLLNSADTLGEIDSELIGEGSFANSQLVSVTEGKQQSFINNRVTNYGPHSTGLINQRGVLLDQSKLIFNGIGQIIHGAHGSKADQKNRVLMMSPDARGDANPLLLIDENDVIAAHAASVGPVDPVQMNYLMSRGIPYQQAQRLVIRGFLGAVLDAIPDQAVRQEMIAILERKLINGQRYTAN